MSAREKLKNEIIKKAVVHGKVILSSGKEADYYVDLRRVTLDHIAAPLVGEVMLDLTKDLDFDAVGGLTLGADPVATAMLHAAAAQGRKLDAFVVRKAEKAHGLQRRIEGPDVKGRRVLAVEDTSTTGGSVMTAVEALREAGAEVVAVSFDSPAERVGLTKGAVITEFGGSRIASSADLNAAMSSRRPGDTVAFNTLQNAVNRNMVASLAVPCFRVGYTITTTKLDAFYKQVKGNGVTMTALLAKAVAVVLARHPQVNAATSADGTAMAYPAAVNVAVAVAMEDGGLITPVLANADKTDIYSLARNWADLVSRARSKQLQPEEYSTGTFTLSNLGMFGVDRFDAILPPGTGAILAVAASRPTVVAGKDGSMRVASQMQVNLTCDHRVIYGAHAAAFLKDLAQLIETNPESLAL